MKEKQKEYIRLIKNKGKTNVWIFYGLVNFSLMFFLHENLFIENVDERISFDNKIIFLWIE